jgi:hypothetical protein
MKIVGRKKMAILSGTLCPVYLWHALRKWHCVVKLWLLGSIPRREILCSLIKH